MSDPLLVVDQLAKSYRHPRRFAPDRPPVEALRGVSFTIAPGETLGLVGESGCGKSTLARTIVRLEEATAGRILFRGQSVRDARGARLRALRQEMQIVFQDPYSALDPRMTAGEAIAEGIVIHRLAPRRELADRVAALLQEVGLDPGAARWYPHQFSGGQRQRIGIARALAVRPSLLICDEPVSALDVSVQAQVVNLLADLQRDRRLACLFIAHDLAVVRQLARRIAVMYLGRLVEVGPAAEIVAAPRHPYTQALLSAAPVPDPDRQRQRIVLAGDPPSPAVVAPGCAFAPRCFHPRKDTRCAAERPVPRRLGTSEVACHHAEETGG